MNLTLEDSKEYISIDYPGVVSNSDNALLTLGGETAILQAYKNEKSINLKFRPDDYFCKPIPSTLSKTFDLILKVRRNKNSENKKISVQILGIVEEIFTFESKADYQYLPIKKSINTGVEVIHDSVILEEISDTNFLNNSTGSCYVLPSTFSLIKNPKVFIYEKDKTNLEMNSNDLQSQAISDSIPSSPQTTFLKYTDDIVPDSSKNSGLIEKLDEKNKLFYEELINIFKVRPIWSRNGIFANCKTLNYEGIKRLLPLVAFYWKSGPWRTLWNRFGYDPRKNLESKIYQTLNFRLRKQINFNVQTASSVRLKKDKALSSYKLNVGEYPSFKQNYYQICDVNIPGVIAYLKENDGKEKVCTERDGWCVVGTIDKCRDHLTKLFEDMDSESTGSFKKIMTKKSKRKRKIVTPESTTSEEMSDNCDT